MIGIAVVQVFLLVADELAGCLATMSVDADLLVSEDYVSLVVLHAVLAFFEGEETDIVSVNCEEEGLGAAEDVRRGMFAVGGVEGKGGEAAEDLPLFGPSHKKDILLQVYYFMEGSVLVVLAVTVE